MIIDRILKIVDYEGISKRSFYTKTGLSNGFLDKPKDVGVSKIETILKVFPYVDPLWLFIGQGEMLLSNPKSSNQKMMNEGTKSNTTEVEFLKSKIELLEKSLKDKDKLISILEKNQK